MDLRLEEDNYFGLDLGNSSIRVVQMKKGGDKPVLTSYGDIETPFALLASDSSVDRDKLVQIIKKLISDAGISGKNVVAGLKATNVFTSVISMPNLSAQELEHAIRYQADKYIPMPIDEAKIDYFVIGQNPTKEDEMEVLLVATPENIANKYLSICQKAGLELMALDINAIAQIRSLMTVFQGAAVIVDFGALTTDITVVSGQIPRLVRSVNVGTKSLNRIVGQNLGIDEDQASQFIEKFGLLQTKIEGQVYRSLKDPLNNVVEEINKSIKYVQDHGQIEKVEKIIITGGASNIIELPTFLANSTGITVEIGNPWAYVNYPAGSQETLMSNALSYATAVGLAMRNM